MGWFDSIFKQEDTVVQQGDDFTLVSDLRDTEGPTTVDIHLTSLLQESGKSGLEYFGGYVDEDIQTALQYPRAARVFKRMGYDATITAILYMSEQLIRKTRWTVEPASDSPADRAAAAFLEDCMDDMKMPWADVIAEAASKLQYGWSYAEQVFKIREDGRIGWDKIAGRSQETLERWEFSQNGSIRGMWQQAAPRNELVFIPLRKSLLFRTTTARDNPEGRSLLRGAHRAWYFKTKIEELEGIGIERDLAGLPVLTVPEGIDIWNQQSITAQAYRQQAKKIVTGIKRDENEGVVLPHGWDLTLLTSGSRRAFDTNQIINRWDQRIAITMLSDIVMLGADKVGSFALADVKKSLLAASLETQLMSIAEVINRYGVSLLFELNNFENLTGLPKAVPDQIETPDVEKLGNYVQRLSASGIDLSQDQRIVDFLLRVASLPAAQVDVTEVQQMARDITQND